MSAILKCDFQKRNQLRFSEVDYLNYTQKKKPNPACDNYSFPKTRGNKNKQYTHSTPFKKKWWEFEEKWGKWNSCPTGTVRLVKPLDAV